MADSSVIIKTLLNDPLALVDPVFTLADLPCMDHPSDNHRSLFALSNTNSLRSACLFGLTTKYELSQRNAGTTSSSYSNKTRRTICLVNHPELADKSGVKPKLRWACLCYPRLGLLITASLPSSFC